MTDIDKVKNYYANFDEWSRLEAPEGQLEFEILIDIIRQYLPAETTVFDLGAGPGRYTCALSLSGYKMYLADLSPELINIARDKIKEFGKPENVIQAEVCNALDLSAYSDEMFNAVLLFGPLYHLTSEEEVMTCLREVHRVLKKGGKIFAVYIPRITGLTGLIERAFYAPGQVNADKLLKVYADGIFNNLSNTGFQEGAYIKTGDMLSYMSKAGFNQLLLRSVRGIGNKQEANILSLRESNPAYYKTILQIINETATESAVIETCGHAFFVGERMM